MAKKIRCPECGIWERVGIRLIPFSLSPSSIRCQFCKKSIKTDFDIRSEIAAARLFWFCVLGTFSMSLCGVFGGIPLLLGLGSIILGSTLIAFAAGSILGLLAAYLLAVPFQLLIESTIGAGNAVSATRKVVQRKAEELLFDEEERLAAFMGYGDENALFTAPKEDEVPEEGNPVSNAGKHQLIQAVQNTNEMSDEERRLMEFMINDSDKSPLH